MSDLSELFQRDPLTYTTTGGELRQIIEKMRSMRHQFNAGAQKAGSTKPVSEKQKQILSLASKLDLDL